MELWQAVVLGIVEGLTEFLPVSSTGHITIAAGLMGLDVSNRSVTGFTAVIQVGAIAAVLFYFWKDISRLFMAWVRGLRNREARTDPNYRMAWVVIAGSLPIVFVALLAKDLITGPLRSLWVVGIALIAWSFVMWLGDRLGKQTRGEKDMTIADGLKLGFAQCLALIPGVSRSGATISTGLLLGIDRVTATRVSFLLGIPALVAAGVYEAPSALADDGVGVLQTVVGIVVSFIVAYASIAWLLKFVQSNKFTAFVIYRVVLGTALLIALGVGAISATGAV
ncbi:undecaprenyl-diphosphate phosphatase [Epidermidibacterium keratini]|uniref:Undecaprenyl-diphosphatase n=1 Tax=Epidermidibacterium keratini TaxID=1891644 RepID=A0A7L4YSK0_9ACTN|nr:undecaprenyl-diphosphate phosphatase [Epidermidibacterium keratini]QHC02070.1 undecaprenyl-diphosphate phosphatase [Epidermidibacterium keratini]